MGLTRDVSTIGTFIPSTFFSKSAPDSIGCSMRQNIAQIYYFGRSKTLLII
jgi:hypothetical protein